MDEETRMWRDPAVPVDEVPAALAAVKLEDMAKTLLAYGVTYQQLPADAVRDEQRLNLIRLTDMVEDALLELEIDDRVTDQSPDYIYEEDA